MSDIIEKEDVNKEDVMRMFLCMRRLYLNHQGTDNIWCLREEEEVKPLMFIEHLIEEAFEEK